MKKAISLVLVLVLILCVVGCAPKPTEPVPEPSEKDEPAVEVNDTAEADEPITDSVDTIKILAFNCTIDGEKSLEIESAGELTATAEVPDGMAVDCWLINGKKQVNGANPGKWGEPTPYDDDTYSFTAEGDTVIEAVMREEKTVSVVSGELQFLKENGRVGGDTFEKFVFEDDYVNPVTDEKIKGGTVTVCVSADVPSGFYVDYWLINQIPYHFDSSVSWFKVFDLDETTEYEPVLKKAAVPAPAAASTPNAIKYSVNCTYCTFSGGGYSGASSGSVAAGTTITVTSNYGGWVWWKGSNPMGSRTSPAANSFTYVVNSNCSFIANDIVN